MDSATQWSFGRLLASQYNDVVMTNIQLLISVGLPMLVLGFGMWMNSNAVNHLGADRNARFAAVDARLNVMDNRMTAMQNRFAGALDRMIGAINDLDKRLSIIEDRLHPR